jgi:hypothetical protein
MPGTTPLEGAGPPAPQGSFMDRLTGSRLRTVSGVAGQALGARAAGQAVMEGTGPKGQEMYRALGFDPSNPDKPITRAINWAGQQVDKLFPGGLTPQPKRPEAPTAATQPVTPKPAMPAPTTGTQPNLNQPNVQRVGNSVAWRENGGLQGVSSPNSAAMDRVTAGLRNPAAGGGGPPGLDSSGQRELWARQDAARATATRQAMEDQYRQENSPAALARHQAQIVQDQADRMLNLATDVHNNMGYALSDRDRRELMHGAIQLYGGIGQASGAGVEAGGGIEQYRLHGDASRDVAGITGQYGVEQEGAKGLAGTQKAGVEGYWNTRQEGMKQSGESSRALPGMMDTTDKVNRNRMGASALAKLIESGGQIPMKDNGEVDLERIQNSEWGALMINPQGFIAGGYGDQVRNGAIMSPAQAGSAARTAIPGTPPGLGNLWEGKPPARLIPGVQEGTASLNNQQVDLNALAKFTDKNPEDLAGMGDVEIASLIQAMQAKMAERRQQRQ